MRILHQSTSIPVSRLSISTLFLLGLVACASPTDREAVDQSQLESPTVIQGNQSDTDQSSSNSPASQPGTDESAIEARSVLDMESWNNTSQQAWDGPIGTAYTESHPGIELLYLTTQAKAYDEEVAKRLADRSAADLIWCRSFDRSLELFRNGWLLPVDGIDQGNLPDSAFRAWTDPDSDTRYCMPMAAITQGFVYNRDAFDELGLEEPTTIDEFNDVLAEIDADGRYVPLAVGLEEPWAVANLSVNILGPVYWGAEEGRQLLLDGEITFTDQRFVDLMTEVALWKDYLPPRAESVDTARSLSMFQNQEAIIKPVGSWSVKVHEDVDFEVGIIQPLRLNEDSRCAMVDHPDVGIGINAATDDEQVARDFLEWMTTEDFAEVLVENVPGMFSLQTPAPSSPFPLAREFNDFRQECDTSLRLTAGIAPDAAVELEQYLWDLISQLLIGEITPEQATQLLDQEYGSYLVSADGGS